MISKELARQTFFFALVGIAATLTHYCVALLLTKTEVLSVYWANLAGYLTAVCVSYFGHGHLTFKVELNHAILKKFVIVSISTFLASEGILFALENYLQLKHEISLAVVVVTIPFISFVLNKFWVFTHKHPQQSQTP